jgi:6-phosphogluconolactonase
LVKDAAGVVTAANSTMREILVLPDLAALAQAAADRFVSIADHAIEINGRFTVALSGGSTPRALYAVLIDRLSIDWSRVHVFWGDERCVPPDQPDSNYGLAWQMLLSKVKVPEANVHRIKSELDPDQAALEYEAELRRVFEPALPLPRSFPRFDLILLGMGAEGHTASLFPGTAAIHEQQRWVVAHYVEQLKTNRVTLTPPVLNQAAHVIFMVAGADKASALQAVLYGEYDPDRYPAQIVSPADGSLSWLIDRAASDS